MTNTSAQYPPAVPRHTVQFQGIAERAAREAAVPVADATPRFYSVAQAARLLGMSTMTLYRAINGGEFPAVRIRNRLIVPAKAIESMADVAVAQQSVVDAASWVPVPRSGGAV
jgi:excisionase family DNA binding protein